MNRLKLLIFLVFSLNYASAQIDNLSRDSAIVTEPNPIVFGEMYVGASRGLVLGSTINFQYNHSLFTIRYNYILNLNVDFPAIFVPIPSVKTAQHDSEIAVLYGYRFIKDDYSLSFSGGISYNNISYYNRALDLQIADLNYVGFPFEANVKLFNAVKRRYRIIYGIVPIGRPTAFSRSIGLKFLGNISKKSYFGIGLNVGLGYHKVY